MAKEKVSYADKQAAKAGKRAWKMGKMQERTQRKLNKQNYKAKVASTNAKVAQTAARWSNVTATAGAIAGGVAAKEAVASKASSANLAKLNDLINGSLNKNPGSNTEGDIVTKDTGSWGQ